MVLILFTKLQVINIQEIDFVENTFYLYNEYLGTPKMGKIPVLH